MSEETKTILIDSVGIKIEINPYLFGSCVVGMIAGAFRGYYKQTVCNEIAIQLDNIITRKGGCCRKWLRTVSDIVDVAEIVADEDITTEEVLGWVRDNLLGKME